MATYTTNYNLKKPALADKIRIADFNGNSDTIDGAMHDNAVLGAQLKSDIGIVENTNTATHNISAGQYVIWKGDLYTASDAISSGATLSNANLTAVSGGGLNALNSKIDTSYYTITNIGFIRFMGKLAIIDFTNSSGQIPSTGYQLPYTFRDVIKIPVQYYNGSVNEFAELRIEQNGQVYVRKSGADVNATYVIGQAVCYLT